MRSSDAKELPLEFPWLVHHHSSCHPYLLLSPSQQLQYGFAEEVSSSVASDPRIDWSAVPSLAYLAFLFPPEAHVTVLIWTQFDAP